MLSFPKSMQELIREFSRLPSIGEKSATRLAYHILSGNQKLAENLANALKKASQSVKLCQSCFFFSEEDLCSICRNTNRDQNLICVVEKPVDVMAIEKSAEFRGYYHVLHGLWAPLRGQGEENMKIKELISRVKDKPTCEVILATNTTVEGDATALFVAKKLSELGVKASRLAQGMPKGGELEYADDLTVSKALSGRINF